MAEGNGKVKGKVAWFHSIKGFGFLKSPGRPDVFVHWSAVDEKLKVEGRIKLEDEQPVTFEIGQDKNGRTVAVNVEAEV